jgi:hypothetical protein
MEPRKTSGRQGADLAKAEIVVADAGNLVKDTFYPREIRKNHFSEDFAIQTQSVGYLRFSQPTLTRTKRTKPKP